MKSTVLLLSMFLSSAAFGSTQAAAGGEPEQREVRYDDLDLSVHDGVSRLYARIHHAARAVCWTPGLLEVTERPKMRRCAAQALAQAVSDVNAPLLSRYYLSRNPGAQLPVRNADAGGSSLRAMVRADRPVTTGG
jgi:UrcA family protein